MLPISDPGATPGTATWYRTVWRWHFYAGLFCIPLVIWLALTGSVYLWRPQVEAWLDRPFDHLTATGPAAPVDAQVAAALRAVPGATLHRYVLPTAPDRAVRILVTRGGVDQRVFLHPRNAGRAGDRDGGTAAVPADLPPPRRTARRHGRQPAGGDRRLLGGGDDPDRPLPVVAARATRAGRNPLSAARRRRPAVLARPACDRRAMVVGVRAGVDPHRPGPGQRHGAAT